MILCIQCFLNIVCVCSDLTITAMFISVYGSSPLVSSFSSYLVFSSSASSFFSSCPVVFKVSFLLSLSQTRPARDDIPARLHHGALQQLKYVHASLLKCIAQESCKNDRTSQIYSTILYSTLLYSTLLYSTLLYSTLLYYTILYYTILYYTILPFSRPLHVSFLWPHKFWVPVNFTLPVMERPLLHLASNSCPVEPEGWNRDFEGGSVPKYLFTSVYMYIYISMRCKL